ncbi:Oxidoreductase BOA1 [Paramyrothecium foliicola]|nr:Oxidoreductase BOA1 [Paramyrothecium foliicola]
MLSTPPRPATQPLCMPSILLVLLDQRQFVEHLDQSSDASYETVDLRGFVSQSHALSHRPAWVQSFISALDAFLVTNGLDETFGFAPLPSKDPVSKFLTQKLGTPVRLFVPAREGHDDATVGYIAYDWVMVYAGRQIRLGEELADSAPAGFSDLRREMMGQTVSEIEDTSALFVVVTDGRNFSPLHLEERRKIKLPFAIYNRIHSSQHRVTMSIAIAGGAAGIGRGIANALKDGQHKYIILSRKPSKSPHVVAVDYANVEALVATIEAHNVHTIISSLPIDNDDSGQAQLNLIEAADKAKCTKRFLPSEFGMVYTAMNIAHIPSYAWKLKAAAALETTSLEFSLVSIGLFLDYWSTSKIPSELGQTPAMWIDLENNFAVILGDGDAPMVLTHSSDVGPFVVAMLGLPKWERRYSIIGDRVTLKQAVGLAQELMGPGFKVQHDSVEVLEANNASLTPHMEKALPADGSHTPMYKRMLSLTALNLLRGDLDLDTSKSLNSLFPNIPTLKVRDVVEAWSKGKQQTEANQAEEAFHAANWLQEAVQATTSGGSAPMPPIVGSTEEQVDWAAFSKAEDKAHVLADIDELNKRLNSWHGFSSVSSDEQLTSRRSVGSQRVDVEEAFTARSGKPDTEVEPQELSELWKQILSEAYAKVIKQALDQGYRLRNYKFSVDSFMYKPQIKAEADGNIDDMLNDLNLGDLD